MIEFSALRPFNYLGALPKSEGVLWISYKDLPQKCCARVFLLENDEVIPPCGDEVISQRITAKGWNSLNDSCKRDSMALT